MQLKVVDGKVPRYNILILFIPYFISCANGLVIFTCFKNEDVLSKKLIHAIVELSGRFLPFVKNPEFNWPYGYENLLVAYVATSAMLFPLSIFLMLSLKITITSKEFWHIESAKIYKIIGLVLACFLLGMASTYVIYSGELFQIHEISIGKAWLLQKIMLSGKFGMIAIVSFHFYVGVFFAGVLPIYTAKLIKAVKKHGDKQ